MAMKIRPLPLDDQPNVCITNKGRTLRRVSFVRKKTQPVDDSLLIEKMRTRRYNSSRVR